MQLLPLAYLAGRFIVTSSVSKVVKEVVRNNLTDPETLIQSGAFKVGVLTIGAVSGAIAGNYVDSTVDEAKTNVEKLQEKLAEQKKEPQKEETQ